MSPDRLAHMEHSLERYGSKGEDIHAFLDEPVKMQGKAHREFRHDTETIRLVGKLFEKEYGRELAENIALDHIMLDHKTRLHEQETTKLVKLQRVKLPNGTIQTRICLPKDFVDKLKLGEYVLIELQDGSMTISPAIVEAKA